MLPKLRGSGPGIRDSGDRSVRKFAQQQTFDGATARNAMPHEPCRKHASIVDNEQIAGTQMIGHPGERQCSMAPVCRESTSSRDCPRSTGGR